MPEEAHRADSKLVDSCTVTALRLALFDAELKLSTSLSLTCDPALLSQASRAELMRLGRPELRAWAVMREVRVACLSRQVGLMASLLTAALSQLFGYCVQ